MSGTDGDAGSGRPRGAISDEEERSPDEAQDADSEQEPALVLIVEDEEPIAEALTYIIEEAGYRSAAAENGKQGLEIARAHHPALIITDLMMPLMSGAELIAAIRAESGDGVGPAPSIVLMTAGGMRHAQGVGADEVLLKPFDVEQVEAILQRYLGSGRRRSVPGGPSVP